MPLPTHLSPKEEARSWRLGIGMHSYGFAWGSAARNNLAVPFKDALSFLEYAHALGAAGVQVALRPGEQPQAARLRRRAEELQLGFEGQLNLPKDDADLVRFETEVQAIRAGGAVIARTAVSGARRYERFKSLAEFEDFRKRGRAVLVQVEPVLRRHQLRLAVENHKDWLVPELIEILQGLSSEWIGACVDTGNSIALLEDPDEVVAALSPFAMTTHIKDMAVMTAADGFQLSEVPLGNGFLNLKSMITTLRRAQPRIALNLEMITRDPLLVPCLTPGYWPTFPEMKASQLGRTLSGIKTHSATSLPHSAGLAPSAQIKLEDDNVRRCLGWTG